MYFLYFCCSLLAFPTFSNWTWILNGIKFWLDFHHSIVNLVITWIFTVLLSLLHLLNAPFKLSLLIILSYFLKFLTMQCQGTTIRASQVRMYVLMMKMHNAITVYWFNCKMQQVQTALMILNDSFGRYFWWLLPFPSLTMGR